MPKHRLKAMNNAQNDCTSILEYQNEYPFTGGKVQRSFECTKRNLDKQSKLQVPLPIYQQLPLHASCSSLKQAISGHQPIILNNESGHG